MSFKQLFQIKKNTFNKLNRSKAIKVYQFMVKRSLQCIKDVFK